MKLIIFGIFVVLVWLQYEFWLAPAGFVSVVTLKKTIAAERLENTKLALRNNILSADVTDLKSGNEAIEERARSELGMVKKGEVFYQYY